MDCGSKVAITVYLVFCWLFPKTGHNPPMLDIILTHFPYIAAFVLLALGAHLLISTRNYVKKLYGLAIFQGAVLLFVISLGYIDGGFAPIHSENITRPMVNPLPQVLILTAIVVGIAILAVGLALSIRIKKAFDSVEEPFEQ